MELGFSFDLMPHTIYEAQHQAGPLVNHFIEFTSFFLLPALGGEGRGRGIDAGEATLTRPDRREIISWFRRQISWLFLPVKNAAATWKPAANPRSAALAGRPAPCARWRPPPLPRKRRNKGPLSGGGDKGNFFFPGFSKTLPWLSNRKTAL